jgi:hypothetical protein
VASGAFVAKSGDVVNRGSSRRRRSSVAGGDSPRTFTATVVVTFVALAREDPVVWVSYVPLFPLALLMLTGLYLFALPYVGRWRSARRAA